MSRPRKFRRVCCMPATEYFGPICSGGKSNAESTTMIPLDCPIIQMSVDEYETIRLMDLEGCTQETCAAQMGIARSTVQGIYIDARRKLADALVHGKRLIITGGDYTLCENFETGCGHGCRKKCHQKSLSKSNV